MNVDFCMWYRDTLSHEKLMFIMVYSYGEALVVRLIYQSWAESKTVGTTAQESRTSLACLYNLLVDSMNFYSECMDTKTDIQRQNTLNSKRKYTLLDLSNTPRVADLISTLGLPAIHYEVRDHCLAKAVYSLEPDHGKAVFQTLSELWPNFVHCLYMCPFVILSQITVDW